MEYYPKFMREGYFLIIHKIKKTKVKYNSSYFGQLVYLKMYYITSTTPQTWQTFYKTMKTYFQDFSRLSQQQARHSDTALYWHTNTYVTQNK